MTFRIYSKVSFNFLLIRRLKKNFSWGSMKCYIFIVNEVNLRNETLPLFPKLRVETTNLTNVALQNLVLV